MWQQRLKQYDKLLRIYRKLDGSIEIHRQSPFNSERMYLVLTIMNQLPGMWVVRKIMLMDTQRRNLVGDVVQNNKRILNQKDDPRITQEIAEMFKTGGSIFIN